jgi:hypothetical protein
LISYGILGGDVGDEIAGCLLWRFADSFVVYEDGQLIILGDRGLEIGTLTIDEMESLLTRIENTGYFGVVGTGELRENDPIYEIDSSVQVGDGAPYIRITVRGRTYWIYTPLEDYLASSISQSLEIIRSYETSTLSPYHPDQIELFIWELPFLPEEFEWKVATPIPPIEDWPTQLPMLEDLLTEEGFGRTSFLEDEAKIIRDYFNQFPSGRIFNSNGQDYYVAACPMLP